MADLALINLESLARLHDRLEGLVRGRLWAKVMIAMLLGILLGFVIGPEVGWIAETWTRPMVAWMAFPGRIFLAMIQMIVIPLVVASVIRGLAASEDMAQLKRLGTRAFLFFGLTTALAVIIGMIASGMTRPGHFVHLDMTSSPTVTTPEASALPAFDELPTVITGLLPRNPLAAMVGGEMLQIIIFSILIGVALLAMPVERSTPIYDLMGSLQDVCMTVVGWAMRLAPFAVFGLMAQLTATVGFDTLAGMGIYVLTVLGGLGVLFGVHLALAAVLGRCGPRRFLTQTRELLLLAFSTSSSAAVMPLSIETAEGLGVRGATARLIIPLGATVNMTGTAVYQGAATVFLAQVFGVELGPGALAIVVVTAVAASIGSPATPGVGMAILATVLGGVGIPIEGIVLLIGVDRLLDMSRTSVNVAGDLVACLVLDRFADASEASGEPAASSLAATPA